MGIFNRWRDWRLQRKMAISDNAFYREMFGALSSKSGATVNWRTAIQAVTAMACARVIAEGLAQVPCKVFKEDSGTRVPATDHPLYTLLHDGPNEWQTSYDFFEQIGLHLAFCGNFFAWKNTYKGRVKELLPFEPQLVTVKQDGWSLSYEVALSDGKRQQIPARDMWHIRGPSWNGWMGLEGVHIAREAIGLAMATEEHGARIFRNGAKIGGVLSTDQVLNQEQVSRIRESWQSTYGGNENTGKTAVVWGGFKYMAASMLNDQAQFNETRKFQVEEVCRAFRVMPIMVGYSDKTATYASSEQMFLAHVVHTLGPWYARVERSAAKHLLGAEDLGSGHYIKFVAQGLLRGAAKDRAEYFTKALGSGGSPAWMTQDEVRELEELNPMGGTAAELPQPSNVGGFPSSEAGADPKPDEKPEGDDE